MTSREADMDGMLHTTNRDSVEDCGCNTRCPLCGARRHLQGVYGGLMDLCESCPEDKTRWRPAGTYELDNDGYVVGVRMVPL